MLCQKIKVKGHAREVICFFESVDSDKKGTSSDGAFDDACKQENAKLGRTKILLLSVVS